MHKLKETHASIESVKTRLLDLCNTHGGAWSFASVFGKVWFYQAASPSRLPDYLHGETTMYGGEEGLLAYKGKLRGFTKAQIIREQNRAIGCE